MPTKFDKSPAGVARRKRALDRLEIQLQTGYKTVTDEETGQISTAPLSDADKTRIKKEIETLKTRLVIVNS